MSRREDLKQTLNKLRVSIERAVVYGTREQFNNLLNNYEKVYLEYYKECNCTCGD